PLADAVVEAWQADPYGWYNSTTPTALAQAWAAAAANSPATGSSAAAAPSTSCRAAITPRTDGTFTLHTVTPGVYGPPQHVNLRVSAPGYETLFTRIYFSGDPWLRQLAVAQGEDVLRLDPRVLGGGSGEDGESGSKEAMVAYFRIVLAPAASAPYALAGEWMDGGGGCIAVTVDGGLFRAVEVPHPRSWGTTAGTVAGGAVLSADFRAGVPLDGVVVPAVASSAPESFVGGLAIEWSDGGRWLKAAKTAPSNRYCYVRLWFYETLRARPGGASISVSEVALYEGIGGPLHEVPAGGKMPPGGDGGSRYSVSCSSELAPEYPCWRAFDGEDGRDAGAAAAWRSVDAAKRQSFAPHGVPLPAPHEYITVDFGAGGGGCGGGVSPTAVGIQCSPQDSDASGNRGCPRSFALAGSNDGQRWTTLTARRQLALSDFPLASGGWGFFDFGGSAAVDGRQNGDRCGSCDTAPAFLCALDAPDASCASRVCGANGRCAALPRCPPGTTAAIISAVGATTAAASVLGAIDGICCGGYYCPEGSTSPTERACGLGNYCPPGSGWPLSVPAGFYATSEGGAPDSPSTRSEITICPVGMYCEKGLRKPCPAGRFGEQEGLSTADCSGLCPAGTVCTVGSALPTPARPGFFSPDGRAEIPCPASRAGDGFGHTGPACAGPCPAGYYCPIGTPRADTFPCPAGTFNAAFGGESLSDCSTCPEGYFCPHPATKNGTAHPCGSIGVYCAEGSVSPAVASAGFYTTGGGGDGRTRSAEQQSEPGSFCYRGQRFLCPAGTLTEEWGLEAPVTPTGFRCSGNCPAGFYCPAGTVTPIPCPAGTFGKESSAPSKEFCALCPPTHWCPQKTTEPIPCPAGSSYGGETGLTTIDCSSECTATAAGASSGGSAAAAVCLSSSCPAGYYCPASSLGVASPRECGGEGFFCPAASAAPTAVQRGYYSVGGDGSIRTRTGERQCEPGTYCLDGALFPCPAGTFGNVSGLSDESCSALCPEGAGWYCEAGSGSATAAPCMWPGSYCPQSSAAPVVVSLGGVSVATPVAAMLYVAQAPCPEGSYCVNGVRNLCPAGSYGDRMRLSSSSCSGLCSRGHYCPHGSISPTETPCPPGTFGNKRGLGDAACSGRCRRGSVCAAGTADP
ncbi:unnamed protein product, partial [Phaeothamnion confervicola]